MAYMAERSIDVSAVDLGGLFGDFDCNIKQVEKELSVSVSCRDSILKILGGEEETETAKRAILSMIESLLRNLPVRCSQRTENRCTPWRRKRRRR